MLTISLTSGFTSANALYLLIVPQWEKMLFTFFIATNVKKYTTYLKTILLKNC